MTMDNYATEVVFSSPRHQSQHCAADTSASKGKKAAKTEKGATAATASVSAPKNPATIFQDLDSDDEILIVTPKTTPQPTQPLETEDRSPTPEKTKPKVSKQPRARKGKPGEAGRKAAREALKRRKELAVKNTNTTAAPKENLRSMQNSSSLSHAQPTQPPETEGATASVRAATHTAHQTQDLDADDETMISTPKSASEPTQPLEREGPSRTAPQTESEGANNPTGRKPKQGEPGKKANGELAVKNTNKSQDPKRHRRKQTIPMRATAF